MQRRRISVSTVPFVLTIGGCAASRPDLQPLAAASPIPNAESRVGSSKSHSTGPVARIEDGSGKLVPEERSALIFKLERASTEAKVQLGVSIAPSLNGESIEQLGERTFRAWALGESGILVIIVIKERQARIETGRAIEAIVPDDLAHAILVKHLNPHLRAGDFNGGIVETFDAVLALLQPENRPKVVP